MEITQTSNLSQYYEYLIMRILKLHLWALDIYLEHNPEITGPDLFL